MIPMAHVPLIPLNGQDISPKSTISIKIALNYNLFYNPMVVLTYLRVLRIFPSFLKLYVSTGAQKCPHIA